MNSYSHVIASTLGGPLRSVGCQLPMPDSMEMRDARHSAAWEVFWVIVHQLPARVPRALLVEVTDAWQPILSVYAPQAAKGHIGSQSAFPLAGC